MSMRFETVEQYEALSFDPNYEPDDEFEFCKAANELFERKLGKGLIDRILDLSDEAAQALEALVDERIQEIMNICPLGASRGGGYMVYR